MTDFIIRTIIIVIGLLAFAGCCWTFKGICDGPKKLAFLNTDWLARRKNGSH